MISGKSRRTFWDSSVCWNCYLRQSRRHVSSSTATSSPLALNTTQPASNQRSVSGATRLEQLKSQRTTTLLPVKPVRARGVHSSSDNKARVESIESLIHSSETQLTSNAHTKSETLSQKTNVRSRLRQWQAEHGDVLPILPKEIDTPGTSNSLTRPTIADHQVAADDEGVEGLDSYVQEFDRISEFVVDVDQASLIMRRGDLVDLPSGGSGLANLCIFLRLKDGVYQYLSISGKVFNHNYRSATFVIPNFVDLEELKSIMPYVPDDVSAEGQSELQKQPNCVPRELAAPLIQKLARFRGESEAAYRSFSSAIDHAHRMVAHPTGLKFMCLEDIVTKLTGISEAEGQSSALLYAVSTALLRGEWGFSVDPKTYAESRIIAVESAKNVGVVSRVQDWLRAYQEEMALKAGGYSVPEDIDGKSTVLKNFTRKARALIAESRTIRYTTPEGTVLTCKPHHAKPLENGLDKVHSLEFSNTDRDFIQFMGMHASSRLFFYHQQLRSLPSIILRATGAYSGRALDLDFSHTFLVEIGATQPYDNPFALDRDVFPPIHDVGAEMKAMQEQIDAGQSPADVGELHDSLSALRKDWGDTPVFCIDSKSASDLDDGISIEDIEGSDGEFWFHSHISHISAFIYPGHVLAKYAETRGSSHYLADARLTMLPDWVSLEFSLAPNRPVITFSARMNEKGDVLETKIQPGIIRNVQRVSYEMLDQALEYHNSKGPKLADRLIIKVGPDISKTEFVLDHNFQPPSTAHKKLLRGLYDMSRIQIEKRPKTPFGTFASRNQTLARNGSKSPASYSTDQALSHAQFALTNPSIQMTINSNYAIEKLDFEDQFNRPSRILVQEAMLLTGVIAASWAAERNMPIVFYGTRPATDGLEDVTKMLREKVIGMGKGEHGWSRNVASDVLNFYTLRHVAAHPVRHKLLNFAHYTKITSPLRRYMDLLSLWQIDAALKEEAETGKSSVGRKDTSYLPLTRLDIEKNIRLQDTLSKRSAKYASAHSKHWNIHCLARAHYLNEAGLPSPLTALISTASSTRRMARIEQLEISCDVVPGPGEDHNEPAENEIWEVRIASISPYNRKIMIQPVKRLGTVAELGSERSLRRSSALPSNV